MTPSEVATLRALAQQDWQTKKDLAAKTGSGRRTLYVACKRLLEKGFVKAKPSLRDTRQDFYAITDVGRFFLQAEA